jgi:hypothetical protein
MMSWGVWIGVLVLVLLLIELNGITRLLREVRETLASLDSSVSEMCASLHALESARRG